MKKRSWETSQVWAVIVTSKHSLLKELDSVHETEESALLAQDELYASGTAGYEVLVELYQVENLENG